MPPAADLPEAASQSFDNLYPLWIAGGNTFKNSLALFVNPLLPVFPDQDVAARPIAAWLVLITGLAFTMPSETAPSTVDYNTFFIPANNYIYRLCWLAAGTGANSPAISTAQRAAILSSYNAVLAS